MTPTSHSKARTAGRDDDGSYYADGRTVFRSPITKPNSAGGKNITLGFPVCNLHDACPDEGAAIIAKCLNAHDDLVAIAKIFLGHDERFQVSVGGNPIAVDKMLESARAALASLPSPQVRG